MGAHRQRPQVVRAPAKSSIGRRCRRLCRRASRSALQYRQSAPGLIVSNIANAGSRWCFTHAIVLEHVHLQPCLAQYATFGISSRGAVVYSDSVDHGSRRRWVKSMSSLIFMGMPIGTAITASLLRLVFNPCESQR